MAGALGVQLGGDAYYEGKLEHRPQIGFAERELNLESLRAARSLMWAGAALLSIVMLCLRKAFA